MLNNELLYLQGQFEKQVDVSNQRLDKTPTQTEYYHVCRQLEETKRELEQYKNECGTLKGQNTKLEDQLVEMKLSNEKNVQNIILLTNQLQKL